ncbi:MAG: ribonuclease P protein component 1 [Candidatus Hodarchaeota archaeon]
MEITRKNIIYHELIGLHVKIHESSSKPIIGLEGQVIDETMNMLVIKDQAGSVKKLLKSHHDFLFTLENGKKLLVPGKLIAGRPWDRLKNIKKRNFKNLI